jgi:hypothetical protein
LSFCIRIVRTDASKKLKNGDATPVLEGLKIIVHAEGRKVTARGHVKQHGGTLVTGDTYTSEDKVKELWGSAVDKTFISRSVIVQKQLSVDEFAALLPVT